MNISGAVNVLTTHTSAYIAGGASVNNANNNAGAGASQAVLVAAGDDYSSLAISLGFSAAGEVAVTPDAAVLVVKNTTQAHIDDGALVNARQDITVAAHSEQDILDITVGVAASGLAGLSAAASVIVLNDTTFAYIGSTPSGANGTPTAATANAGGNILIDAGDDTKTFTVAGSVGIGIGGGGGGVGVAVTILTKDTEAFVGKGAVINAAGNSSSLSTIHDGTIDSKGGFPNLPTFHGLAVQAASSEDVTSVGAAGGGGLFFGLGGGVSVEVISSTTQAFIGDNALVNKTLTNPDPTDSVNVSAVNATKVFGFGGGIAGGFVGLAGGIDVGILQNNTAAFIAAGAEVHAQQDVNVNALANKDVQSYAVSGAGGAVALAGSVSVWTIGSAFSSGYADNNGSNSTDPLSSGGSSLSTSTSKADSQTSDIATMLTGSDGYKSSGTQNSSGGVKTNVTKGTTKLSSPGSDGLVSGAKSKTSGTAAYIGGGAHVTAGQRGNGVGSVKVLAREKIKFTATAGTVSGGIAGIGGAVVIVNINSNTQAYIASGATVRAGSADNILVSASLTNDVTGNAIAGLAGLLALGAQVVIIKDTSTQWAHIDSEAVITQAGSLTVQATANRVLNANAAAVTVGAIAIGLGIAMAKADGFTKAQIADGAQVGQQTGLSVDNISVSATDADKITSSAMAVAGGIGAVNLNYTNAVDDPLVTASIGGNVTAAGSITVTASATPVVSATTIGISVSILLAAGGSLAQTTDAPTVQAFISPSSHVTANTGTLSLTAQVIGLSNTATANASGGALVGVNGAEADANSAPVVNAYVGSGAVVTTGLDANVLANSRGATMATAGSTTVGFVAVGLNRATAIVGIGTVTEIGSPSLTAASTNAHVDGGATINAGGSITVGASSNQNTSADATANAGALVAVTVTSAFAIRNDPVAVTINNNAVLTAVNNITISANNATTQTHAGASNNSGGVGAFGFPTTATTVSDSTTATLGSGVHATATLGNFILQAVTNDSGIDSHSDSFAVAGIAVANSDATTTVNDPATAQVGGLSQVAAGRN